MIKITWITQDNKQYMGKIEESIFMNKIMPLFQNHLKPLLVEEYKIIPQDTKKEEIKQDIQVQKKKWWKR